MAIIKPSALVAEIKGKIGGSVFQTSPYGQVVKQGSFGGTRSSVAKQNVLSHESKKPSWWGLTSSTQKLAWDAAAELFPATNRYGDEYTSTGYQLWLRSRMQFPDEIARTVLDPPERVDDGTVWMPTFSVVDGVVSYACERIEGAAPCYLKIFASLPMPATRRRAPNRLRLIRSYELTEDLDVPDATDLYEQIFYPIPAGAIVHYRMVCYAQWSPQILGGSAGYSPAAVAPAPPVPDPVLISESGDYLMSENDEFLIPE